jgi:ribosome-binding factor A
MPSRRLEMLNRQFRQEISELIGRVLRDPGLGGVVSITTVDISPDLRHARVYFSVLGGEEERQRVQSALTRAAGFLRHELAHRLTLRTMPELAFHPDVSIERGERIMELLREVEHEPEDVKPQIDTDERG